MSSPPYSPALAGALALFATAAEAQAPPIPKNHHGLEVVNDPQLYRAQVRLVADKRLVELSEAVPGVQLDIWYATPDNFMKRPLYRVAKAYLRQSAARVLVEVQAELAAQGLGLKVFDGYRPYRVTEQMWDAVHDPRFVADSAFGSRHNRGCAVDLTLIDAKTGQELAMPTPFDDFTPAAAHAYLDLPPEVLANRKLLRDTMERHGFTAIQSEWWHYDFRGWQDYELLDLPIEDIEEANQGL